MASFASFDRHSANLRLAYYNRTRAAEERVKAGNTKDINRRAQHLVLAEIFDEREAAANRNSDSDLANLSFIEI